MRTVVALSAMLAFGVAVAQTTVQQQPDVARSPQAPAQVAESHNVSAAAGATTPEPGMVMGGVGAVGTTALIVGGLLGVALIYVATEDDDNPVATGTTGTR